MTRWLFELGSSTLGPWILPVIGGVTGGLAFILGRKLLDPPVAPPTLDDDAGAELLDGVTRDRRAFQRRKGNTVEVQLRIDLNQEPVRGWVLNRSSGGLCILVDSPLTEKRPLQIRPRCREEVAWCDAVVRSCRQEGEQYEIGLQFQRIPNWSQIYQFG